MSSIPSPDRTRLARWLKSYGAVGSPLNAMGNTLVNRSCALAKLSAQRRAEMSGFFSISQAERLALRITFWPQTAIGPGAW